MTRIEFHEAAAEHEKYMPRAFDKVIGQQVPFRIQPGGRKIGRCTVAGVRVDDDGGGATWTVDIDWQPPPDGERAEDAEDAGEVAGSRLVAELARRDPGMMSMSFAVPEPRTLPRDPLGSVAVRIRPYRPAVPADDGSKPGPGPGREADAGAEGPGRPDAGSGPRREPGAPGQALNR